MTESEPPQQPKRSDTRTNARKDSIFKRVIIIISLIGIAAAVYLLFVPPPNSDTVKIGVLYAGTGPASFAGKPEQEILELLAKGKDDQVNGKRLILEFRDTGGDKDEAVARLEEWSKDPSVVAVIGPTASGESIAVAAKVLELESKLPVLSLAAASNIVLHPQDQNRVNQWVFKFAQNDDLAARKLCRVIKEQVKSGSVAFLHSDDGFGKSGAAVFPSAARDEQISLNAKLRSFQANLDAPDAVVAALPTDLKACVIWGSAPGPARLVKALRKSHPTTEIYLSHGNASQDFIDSLAGQGNGVIVVGSRVLMPANSLDEKQPRDKKIKDFQMFWSTSTRKPQSHFAGHAYDAYNMLRGLINQGITDRESLRKALESHPPFHGITGTFKFSDSNHAGLDTTAFEVYRIMDDHFEPLITVKP